MEECGAHQVSGAGALDGSGQESLAATCAAEAMGDVGAHPSGAACTVDTHEILQTVTENNDEKWRFREHVLGSVTDRGINPRQAVWVLKVGDDAAVTGPKSSWIDPGPPEPDASQSEHPRQDAD